MLFIFKYLHIYHLILFSKVIICLLLNIYVKIMRKYFVIKSFRGTCSSVKILKGCILICRNAVDVHAHLSEC